jgi:hypothetical protein
MSTLETLRELWATLADARRTGDLWGHLRAWWQTVTGPAMRPMAVRATPGELVADWRPDTGALQAQVERLQMERDQAHISRATAHGALDWLLETVGADPAAARLSVQTQAALAEARASTEADAWEGLLGQMESMERALVEIVSTCNGHAPRIAEQALEEIREKC